MAKLKVPCIINNTLPPEYESTGAAGADLRAKINSDVVFMPGERKIIPTGIRLQIPQGFEAQIRPRSGLAFKHGVTLLNSPGTIDSDYRGEIQIIMINLGDSPFTVKKGDRIAQIIFSSVIQANFITEEKLEETQRGKHGFGSTGL